MTRFQYMLAPMEGYTDNAFRRLCFEHGADLTFTEMTRIDGLARKNKVSLKRIEILDDTPTQIQLIGAKEASLEKFLKGPNEMLLRLDPGQLPNQLRHRANNGLIPAYPPDLRQLLAAAQISERVHQVPLAFQSQLNLKAHADRLAFSRSFVQEFCVADLLLATASALPE